MLGLTPIAITAAEKCTIPHRFMTKSLGMKSPMTRKIKSDTAITAAENCALM